MKTGLLVTAGLTLVNANVMAAEDVMAAKDSRRLAAWGGGTGAGDADGCKFLPISDLFKFHVDAYDEDTWTNVVSESQITANVMSIADYVDNEIHLATVDVVFSLDNFNAASQTQAQTDYEVDTGRDPASSNYDYEKWESNSWANDATLDTGRTATTTRPGTQTMGTVCFYKPGYAVDNKLNDDTGSGKMEFDFTSPSDGSSVCGDADFIYAVPHTNLPHITQADILSTTSGNYANATTYLGTTTEHSINTHKTLGVSSTCGTDGNSDGAINDVFTWAVMKATGTLEYNVKVTVDRGSDAHNTFLTNDPSNGALDSKGDKPTIFVTVTVTQTHMTVPHDLLYISGNFDPGEQTIKASNADFVEDFTIEMEAGVSGSVKWVDDDSEFSTFDIKLHCSAELEVTSADGNWHCFDGAEGVPTSSNFELAGTSGATTTYVDTTSSGEDGSAMNSANDCTAYMTQQCVVNDHKLHIEDARHCYNVNEGSENDEACADDEHRGEWPAISPKEEVDFDAYSAIVQAVRLNDVRRYPLGDAAGADNYYTKWVDQGEKDYSVATNSAFATSGSKWQCDDTNGDCSATDPYVVLAAADESDSITVQCFSDSGSGSYGTPTPIVRGCEDDPYVASGCSAASQHPVTCTTESPARLPTGSGQVKIQLPPALFPQFYVFGISTIKSYQVDGTTTVSDVDADHDSGATGGAYSDESSNVPTSADASMTYTPPARRLGAKLGRPAQRQLLDEQTNFIAANTAVLTA